MTSATLIWCVVLAFFGLNVAVAGWLVLRFTVGAWSALIGFNAILIATCYGIIQVAGA